MEASEGAFSKQFESLQQRAAFADVTYDEKSPVPLLGTFGLLFHPRYT